MNSRHLRIFIAVCEAGTFSRAAARLGMSQPALSRIIRELEAAQGLRLFDRTGRGVRLTEAGRVFQDHALRILGELDRLSEEMMRLRGEVGGEVYVSIPVLIGRIVVVPLVKRFAARFPEASVHIYENLNLTTQEMVLSGKADIGVFYEPPSPPGLVSETVAEEDLYLIGRADTIGDGDDPIPMAEAATVPLILQESKAHYPRFINKMFHNAGYRPTVVREVETVDTLLAFAMEGDGATILAYSNVWQEVARGAVVARRIVEPAITRRMCLASRTQVTDILVRETTSLIKEVLAENRALARWRREGTEQDARPMKG
jgi:LysR family nitrogen assimilation transcriptional regulator